MLATAKRVAAALLTGAIMVSGAWAGASLVPVDEEQLPVADKAARMPEGAEGRARRHSGG